ncbi:MAG: hypothetical protein Q4C75_05645 [Bergeyella zoohelcum]|nr:hypothetical protein [Bergeyella zoohelcum]
MTTREIIVLVLFSIGIVMNATAIYKNKNGNNKYLYLSTLIYVVCILNILFD